MIDRARTRRAPGMNERLVILAGLIVGLALVTFPFWYARAAGSPGAGSQLGGGPQLELPRGQSACVEDVPYMRAHHMELLDRWRNAVVREGKKTYVSRASGASYEMSLTKTCLGCHANKTTFCDRCHEYAGVRSFQLFPWSGASRASQKGVECFGCHVAPEEK